MALDEFLFDKISRYIRSRRKVPPDVAARAVYLDDIKSRLTILARAASGNPVDIFPAEREGGFKQNSFFLPTNIAFFPTHQNNLSFYLFRTLYLTVQKQLNYNWYEAREPTLREAQQKARESSEAILEVLFYAYPATLEMYRYFSQHLVELGTDKQRAGASWLHGKWMMDEPRRDVVDTLHNFSEDTQAAGEMSPTTVVISKGVEHVSNITVDKKQQEDYVFTHNFEKVETADEFSGSWRDFDGADDMESQADALDELNMRLTVRVDDVAHSVYQAEFVENMTVSESSDSVAGGHHICYDEWNHTKQEYKKDFCTVYPSWPLEIDGEYYNSTIKKYASTLMGMRKLLTHVNNRMLQQRRQVQGDEFDLDAITDLYADIKSGHTPSENIYIANRKKDKDLAILILLDSSLSSDGYTNGNRVIDVEKQVSILFGEILNEFSVDFSINSFYSKTRNYSTYLTLKEFDEEWNIGKQKIGAIQPTGFTRIGAALRHSGALLDKRTAKNKWVVLISDGKPNDYDKYEGKYGVQDVKQALRELNGRHINSYALAVEAQARYYLPQMFGQNHYQILSTPVELLQSLVKLFEKIKHKT